MRPRLTPGLPFSVGLCALDRDRRRPSEPTAPNLDTCLTNRQVLARLLRPAASHRYPGRDVFRSELRGSRAAGRHRRARRLAHVQPRACRGGSSARRSSRPSRAWPLEPAPRVRGVPALSACSCWCWRCSFSTRRSASPGATQLGSSRCCSPCPRPSSRWSCRGDPVGPAPGPLRRGGAPRLLRSRATPGSRSPGGGVSALGTGPAPRRGRALIAALARSSRRTSRCRRPVFASRRARPSPVQLATWVYGIDAALSGVGVDAARKRSTRARGGSRAAPAARPVRRARPRRHQRLRACSSSRRVPRHRPRPLRRHRSRRWLHRRTLQKRRQPCLACRPAKALTRTPRNLEFAALLHDVGKIAIPKRSSTTRQTDPREWTNIKMHTVEGQRMLGRVGGFMREVGHLVRSITTLGRRRLPRRAPRGTPSRPGS